MLKTSFFYKIKAKLRQKIWNQTAKESGTNTNILEFMKHRPVF